MFNCLEIKFFDLFRNFKIKSMSVKNYIVVEQHRHECGVKSPQFTISHYVSDETLMRGDILRKHLGDLDLDEWYNHEGNDLDDYGSVEEAFEGMIKSVESGKNWSACDGNEGCERYIEVFDYEKSDKYVVIESGEYHGYGVPAFGLYYESNGEISREDVVIGMLGNEFDDEFENDEREALYANNGFNHRYDYLINHYDAQTDWETCGGCCPRYLIVLKHDELMNNCKNIPSCKTFVDDRETACDNCEVKVHEYQVILSEIYPTLPGLIVDGIMDYVFFD